MKDSPNRQLLLANDGDSQGIGSVRCRSNRQQIHRGTVAKVKKINYPSQNLLHKMQAKNIGELAPYFTSR
jgi:hypothetical protein